MRYLAIVLLSALALLRAAGSSAAVDEASLSTAFVQPLVLTEALAHDNPASSSSFDGALALVLAGSLVTLQLRRRQKSLRSPRTFYG